MSAPITIVDDNDRPIGQATKQEAWAQGLLHRVVRVVVTNSKGQLLLQHRSPTKDIFPNTWDTSAAGHVDAGEDYDTAAHREVAEELGFTNLTLTKIGLYRSNEVWHGHHFNRFNQVYTAQSEQMPTQLEAGKIDGFRWFSLEEVKRLLQDTPDQLSDGLRQVLEQYY